MAESVKQMNVNRIYRPDVNEVFGIASADKFGFILTIKDLQITDGVKAASNRRSRSNLSSCSTKDRDCEYNYGRKIRRLLGSIKRNGCWSDKNYQRSKQQSANYEEWMTKVEEPYRSQLIEASRGLTFQPKISLVVPVYNVDEKWLRACVDSLKNQLYSNWELCLADDASPRLTSSLCYRN